LNKNIVKKRLLCYDIFRGITLFCTVLLNSNIDDNVYWIFSETEWNGFKPADCIFSTTLFNIGVSITLTNSIDNKCKSFLLILKKSFIFFLLGFFFNLQKENFTNLEYIRIMGNLERLSITYFFASLIHLSFDQLYLFKKKNIS